MNNTFNACTLFVHYYFFLQIILLIMAIDNFFKMQCVINGLDLNRPIYKYIPLKYVITMLKTQKLLLLSAKHISKEIKLG